MNSFDWHGFCNCILSRTREYLAWLWRRIEPRCLRLFSCRQAQRPACISGPRDEWIGEGWVSCMDHGYKTKQNVCMVLPKTAARVLCVILLFFPQSQPFLSSLISLYSFVSSLCQLLHSSWHRHETKAARQIKTSSLKSLPYDKLSFFFDNIS